MLPHRRSPLASRPPSRSEFPPCTSTGLGSKRSTGLGRRFVTLLAALVLLPSLDYAASIRGTVFDPQGRAVAAAKVTLLTPLNAVEERSTGGSGQYSFTALSRGRYKLVASAPGFDCAPVEITLEAGQDLSVDLQLKIGVTQQQVVVSASLGGALASQVGSSVSVVSAQQMDDRGDRTVSDALREVPGLVVSQSGRWGGATSLFARGGDSDYNLVELDGIEMNQFGGAFDFSALDSAGVERVEVTPSPESALYGTNAVSSVVDIVTHRGDGPPHFWLREEAGSFSTWRIGAGASGLTHGFSWAVDASRLDSAGVVANDQYRNQTALVSLSYPSAGRHQLSFHFIGDANAAGAPGPYGSDPDGLFSGIDRYSRDKQNLFGYAVSDSEQISPRFRQVTTATFSTNDSYYRSPFGDSYSDNLRGVLNTRSEVLLSNRDFLVGGFEYNREQIRDTYIADPSGMPFLLPRTTLAYFLENRWVPNARWTVIAGIRTDDIRTRALPPDASGERPAIPATSVTQANPHVAVAWMARGGGPALGETRIHASLGTGIRAPSGFDLAFTNNPGLKPERSLAFDAGLDQHFWGGRALFKAAYFYTRYKDQIEVLGGSLTNLSTFTSANLGNSRADGLETSFELRPTPTLDFNAGYTLLSTAILALRGTDVALTPFQVGQPLLRRPRNSGFYAITWKRKRITLETDGYLRGKALDLEPNLGTYACEIDLPCLFENKGYTVLDGGFSYRLNRGFELYGRLYNFLDRHYEEVLGYPALPLNFVAGFRYNFPRE
jgi:outer membrane receptor protein involved in Fe transport